MYRTWKLEWQDKFLATCMFSGAYRKNSRNKLKLSEQTTATIGVYLLAVLNRK